MKNACLLAGFSMAFCCLAVRAGTVEDLALKIATIDCGGERGWSAMLETYERSFAQAEHDNDSITRGAYLSDRLADAARRFDAEPTVGALKGVVFILALHASWGEAVPDNWSKELEKFLPSATQFIESNTINWASMLTIVKELSPKPKNEKIKK